MANPMLDFLSGNDSSPDLMNKESQESSWRWATVTAASPLAIRLDNSPSALSATPIDLVGGLKVGDRVWVQLVSRRVVIHGKSPEPEPNPLRRSLASTLTWGSVSGEFTIRSLGLIREIRGAISGNLPVGTTAVTNWWALPEDDRPSINALGYAYLSGGFSGGFLARPDGSMALVNQTGAARNGIHQFTLMYSVD